MRSLRRRHAVVCRGTASALIRVHPWLQFCYARRTRTSDSSPGDRRTTPMEQSRNGPAMLAVTTASGRALARQQKGAGEGRGQGANATGSRPGTNTRQGVRAPSHAGSASQQRLTGSQIRAGAWREGGPRPPVPSHYRRIATRGNPVVAGGRSRPERADPPGAAFPGAVHRRIEESVHGREDQRPDGGERERR